MRLVVLYEEMAPYFLVNIEIFADTYQVPVLLVCKSVNPVAPFQFYIKSQYVQIVYRENFSLEELYEYVKNFQPTTLMQAGWIYKPYFEIVRRLKLNNNILLMDNQWENTIRQKLGIVYFKFKYKYLFHKAFVPGNKQKEFAEHLGFNEKDIHTGFYCCDTRLFEQVYHQKKSNRKRSYTFLFIGRYAPEKNIEILWKVFIEVCEENPNNWQLLSVGKASITPIEHPQIKHLGFLQQKQIMEVLLSTDVFVLPSIFEPWGVVIHEIVTAGIPVIGSSKVGANEVFVKHGENGFIFNPKDKSQLKKYLHAMIQLSDESYFSMCEKSYELSQKINTNNWIKKIYHLCKI